MQGAVVDLDMAELGEAEESCLGWTAVGDEHMADFLAYDSWRVLMMCVLGCSGTVGTGSRRWPTNSEQWWCSVE